MAKQTSKGIEKSLKELILLIKEMSNKFLKTTCEIDEHNRSHDSK